MKALYHPSCLNLLLSTLPLSSFPEKLYLSFRIPDLQFTDPLFIDLIPALLLPELHPINLLFPATPLHINPHTHYCRGPVQLLLSATLA